RRAGRQAAHGEAQEALLGVGAADSQQLAVASIRGGWGGLIDIRVGGRIEGQYALHLRKRRSGVSRRRGWIRAGKAGAGTGVGEGFAGDRDELPIVAAVVQSELEYTKG